MRDRPLRDSMSLATPSRLLKVRAGSCCLMSCCWAAFNDERGCSSMSSAYFWTISGSLRGPAGSSSSLARASCSCQIGSSDFTHCSMNEVVWVAGTLRELSTSSSCCWRAQLVEVDSCSPAAQFADSAARHRHERSVDASDCHQVYCESN